MMSIYMNHYSHNTRYSSNMKLMQIQFDETPLKDLHTIFWKNHLKESGPAQNMQKCSFLVYANVITKRGPRPT